MKKLKDKAADNSSEMENAYSYVDQNSTDPFAQFVAADIREAQKLLIFSQAILDKKILVPFGNESFIRSDIQEIKHILEAEQNVITPKYFAEKADKDTDIMIVELAGHHRRLKKAISKLYLHAGERVIAKSVAIQAVVAEVQAKIDTVSHPDLYYQDKLSEISKNLSVDNLFKYTGAEIDKIFEESIKYIQIAKNAHRIWLNQCGISKNILETIELIEKKLSDIQFLQSCAIWQQAEKNSTSSAFDVLDEHRDVCAGMMKVIKRNQFKRIFESQNTSTSEFFSLYDDLSAELDNLSIAENTARNFLHMYIEELYMPLMSRIEEEIIRTLKGSGSFLNDKHLRDNAKVALEKKLLSSVKNIIKLASKDALPSFDKIHASVSGLIADTLKLPEVNSVTQKMLQDLVQILEMVKKTESVVDQKQGHVPSVKGL